MFCSQCGKKLPDVASVCPSCGHRLHRKDDQGKQTLPDRKTASRARANVLYESKGFPQSYYRSAKISSLIAIVGGAVLALMSQARYHSSQMNIYSNGTLVHSGTLGGGNMFNAEGREWLIMIGIFFICAGVFLLFFAQKQKDAYALVLYENRIDGIKGFQKFTLEYGQVSEVLTYTASAYPTITIVTAGNKYRIIVTHDADKAAEIIHRKQKEAKL